MSYDEIKVIEKRISELMARINILLSDKNRDDETISDLTKLLCILVSGFIEKRIVDIIKAYATKRSSKEIQSYISKSLTGTTNLRIEKIVKLIGLFSPEWEEQIKATERYCEYQESLNYIIGNRNTIAHGGSSSVTMKDIDANFIIIKDFIKEIDSIYRVYA
jgi:hypothetical protein